MLRAVFSVWSWFLLRRLHGAIAVSQSPRTHLKPPDNLPVHIIPPCTDLMRFTTTPLKDSSPKSPVEILFLGRLEKRKGAKILIEAARLLKERQLDVRLTIAGTGEEEDELRRTVAQHRLTNVTFHGHFSSTETQSLYAACDIFCAPSPFGESFGIVLAEAMASSRPVVAADNTGYRTLLTGKGANFLVPPTNAKALADALEKLARNASLRQEMAIWGRAHAPSFDARVVAPRILQVYAEAIERRTRARNAT